MADNLAMKLLIAGIIGAIVGAATADRYRFPAGSVYGFKNQSESGQSRLPVNPVIASAKAGEAGADSSIGPSRIMRSASPDRPEVGPSGPPQWRGPDQAATAGLQCAGGNTRILTLARLAISFTAPAAEVTVLEPDSHMV